MPNTFLCSDHHFDHANMMNFKRSDGITPLRDFSSVEEMNETLVQNHNNTVNPNDKVYFLGDFCINRKGLRFISRLNGDKVLIKGNHCIWKAKDLLAMGFRDIRAYHVLNGLIMAHIPIHPESLARFGAQIHGHLHSNEVLDKWGKIDPRYYCVCMEQINYTPISLEDAQKQIIARGGHVGFKTQGNR